MPDRRRVRGAPAPAGGHLALACAAVAAGAKSLTAIAEWAAAAQAWVLAASGVRRDPRTGRLLVVPGETTIRRTLGKVDADALDQLEAWTAQEIPGAGSFLGALERDALTGECTVPATESSTVRAGEL